MRLLRQLCSARDGTGIVSQERAYEVFLLLNAAFQIGNGFGGSEYQLLRLPDVDHGCSATFYQHFPQLQRVLTRSQRAPGLLGFALPQCERRSFAGGQCGSGLEAARLGRPPTIFGRRGIPPQAAVPPASWLHGMNQGRLHSAAYGWAPQRSPN